MAHLPRSRRALRRQAHSRDVGSASEAWLMGRFALLETHRQSAVRGFAPPLDYAPDGATLEASGGGARLRRAVPPTKWPARAGPRPERGQKRRALRLQERRVLRTLPHVDRRVLAEHPGQPPSAAVEREVHRAVRKRQRVPPRDVAGGKHGPEQKDEHRGVFAGGDVRVEPAIGARSRRQHGHAALRWRRASCAAKRPESMTRGTPPPGCVPPPAKNTPGVRPRIRGRRKGPNLPCGRKP